MCWLVWFFLSPTKFLLLSKDASFKLSYFFLTTSDSHGTLHLALVLVGMHPVTASIRAVSKFSYSSFGVRLSDSTSHANYTKLSKLSLSTLSGLLIIKFPDFYRINLYSILRQRYIYIYIYNKYKYTKLEKIYEHEISFGAFLRTNFTSKIFLQIYIHYTRKIDK